MPIVRIEHAVSNFAKWKQVFDSDPADRKGSGVRRYEILRASDDPNLVMIDLEFDSIGKAQDFVESMQRIWAGPGKAVMVNPSARILDRVEAREI